MSNSYSCTDGVVNLQFKGHFEFKEALPMIADIFKDDNDHFFRIEERGLYVEVERIL